MTYDTGELKAAWEIEAAAKRDEDKRDYDRELAGIYVGRGARFHNAEFVEDRRDRRAGASPSQRSSQQQFASRLQMLLATNEAYAKLYTDTMGSLGNAEAATDRAIAKAQAAWEEARQQLDQTLSRAAKLSDGTRVFKDQWGQVWNEHGQRLSEADSADIEWRSHQPSREQFLEESESVRDRLTDLEALQGFRVDTLGRIRGEMMDENNPKTPEALEGYQAEIETGLSRLGARQLTSDVERLTPAPSSDIALPQIS